MENGPDDIPEQLTGSWEMAARRNEKKIYIA
jgi:hypothetical protein